MKAPLALAAFGLAIAAHADIVSTFDADDEGWRAADVSTTDLSILSSQPAGWESGHLRADEFGSALFVLAAPTAYLGDLSSYYGGAVTFTLSDTVGDGLPYPDLLIRGNGFAMAYATPPPTSLGTTYTIPLSEAGWIGFDGQPVSHSQFLSALTAVDRFGINADWRTGGQDSVTLDDVRVAAAPEPASLLPLALGLLAIRRRRR